MNTTTFKALTWGTVAAAVLSALLLAVVESGVSDFGREHAEDATPATTQPDPGTTNTRSEGQAR
jgi:hypothetical protein